MLNKARKNERMFTELFGYKYQNTGGIYKSRRHELFCAIASIQGDIGAAIWNTSGVIYRPFGYTEIGKFYFSDKTRDRILWLKFHNSKFTVKEATRMWKILEDKYLWGIRK